MGSMFMFRESRERVYSRTRFDMYGLLCPADTQSVRLVHEVLGVVLGRDTLDLGGLPVVLSVRVTAGSAKPTYTK